MSMATGVATGAEADPVGAGQAGSPAGKAPKEGARGFGPGSPAQNSPAESFGARFELLISSSAALPGSPDRAPRPAPGWKEADGASTAVPVSVRGTKMQAATNSRSGIQMRADVAVSGLSINAREDKASSSQLANLFGGERTASARALSDQAFSAGKPATTSKKLLSNEVFSPKALSEGLSSAAAESSKTSRSRESESAGSSGVRKSGTQEKDSGNSFQAGLVAAPASDFPAQQLSLAGWPLSQPDQPEMNAAAAAVKADGEAATAENSGEIQTASRATLVPASGRSAPAKDGQDAPVSGGPTERTEPASGAREAFGRGNRSEPSIQLKAEGETPLAAPAADSQRQQAAETETGAGSAHAQSSGGAAEQVLRNGPEITDATPLPASPATGSGAAAGHAVNQKSAKDSAAGTQRRRRDAPRSSGHESI